MNIDNNIEEFCEVNSKAIKHGDIWFYIAEQDFSKVWKVETKNLGSAFALKKAIDKAKKDFNLTKKNYTLLAHSATAIKYFQVNYPGNN